MTEPHISDLQLELLALDELSPREARVLRGRLSHDPEAQARFDAIAVSNETLLRAMSANEVHQEVLRRVRKYPPERPSSSPRGARWWGLAMAAGALSTAMMVLVWGESDSGIRKKGAPYLMVHRIIDTRAESLTPGAVARAEDRLQLSVADADGRYAVVVSIDGRGLVTLHFPQDESSIALPAADVPYSLPTSYQLDDAPDFERFFLITSQEPLQTAWIVAQARQLAAQEDRRHDARLDGLPDHARQTSWLLRKAP